jgi:hypothetical protein
MLTLMLIGCSERLINDGIDLNFTDSGDELWQGMTRFALPLAPLLDSFLSEVRVDEAQLRGYSTPSGVTSSDGGRARPELGFAVILGESKLGRREDQQGISSGDRGLFIG